MPHGMQSIESNNVLSSVRSTRRESSKHSCAVFVLTIFAALFVACTPKPTPPEPPHVVTIGDAAIPEGTVVERACAVLRAVNCPEGGTVGTHTCEQTGEVLAGDFDFGCIAACRDSDCVRVCHVRCVP